MSITRYLFEANGILEANGIKQANGILTPYGSAAGETVADYITWLPADTGALFHDTDEIYTLTVYQNTPISEIPFNILTKLFAIEMVASNIAFNPAKVFSAFAYLDASGLGSFSNLPPTLGTFVSDSSTFSSFPVLPATVQSLSLPNAPFTFGLSELPSGLSTVILNRCTFSNVTLTSVIATLTTLQLKDCGLSQPMVDSVLLQIDNDDAFSISLNDGTNQAPSVTGYLNYKNAISSGSTIEINEIVPAHSTDLAVDTINDNGDGSSTVYFEVTIPYNAATWTVYNNADDAALATGAYTMQVSNIQLNATTLNCYVKFTNSAGESIKSNVVAVVL